MIPWDPKDQFYPQQTPDFASSNTMYTNTGPRNTFPVIPGYPPPHQNQCYGPMMGQIMHMSMNPMQIPSVQATMQMPIQGPMQIPIQGPMQMPIQGPLQMPAPMPIPTLAPVMYPSQPQMIPVMQILQAPFPFPPRMLSNWYQQMLFCQPRPLPNMNAQPQGENHRNPWNARHGENFHHSSQPNNNGAIGLAEQTWTYMESMKDSAKSYNSKAKLTKPLVKKNLPSASEPTPQPINKEPKTVLTAPKATQTEPKHEIQVPHFKGFYSKSTIEEDKSYLVTIEDSIRLRVAKKSMEGELRENMDGMIEITEYDKEGLIFNLTEMLKMLGLTDDMFMFVEVVPTRE